MFGSFEPEGERVKYGLTTNIRTFNPVKVAFHEYEAIARDVRTARTWRERLGYMFRGPGWAPDGRDHRLEGPEVAEAAEGAPSSSLT